VSDGISFVLHAPADEAYAASLAGEIGALTLKLEAGAVSSLQFGSGVVCIVVWSEALRPQGDALLGALESGVVLVSRVNGAPLPQAWAGFDAIEARGAATDAVEIAALAQTYRVAAFDRSAQLQGVAAATKQPLAARSAYGMAATFAVASLIAPWIMDRAQATDASGAGLQPPSAPAQGAGLLRASLQAMSAPAVDSVPTPTPALDRWLAPADEDLIVAAAPAVESRLVAYTIDAEPLTLTMDLSTIHDVAADPKREAFSVEIEAAVKPNDVLEPLNSAKNN